MICIEYVQVGDEVWAYNPETGETELKEVLNVWVKETDEILHVSTSDGETIDTTTNHPFYVEDKGWVAAGDLEIGDTLVTVDGDKVEVLDIELEKLAEPILVYNLEVEDFHTYFVGEYGVLVHNYISNQQSNEYKNMVLSGEDVTFKTKQDAIDFIKKKFKDFPEELAGHRSSEGWHFDLHSIEGMDGLIEHINLYSKNLGFRVHLFWE